MGNIKTHLISGLIDWLTGAMSEVPITLPAKFDLKGILDLVLQILGLTWDRIRAKLVKRLGEKVVAAAETGVDIVRRLIKEGPIALWEMIKEKAAEIKQQVMDGIRNWVITQIVKQAVIKLLSFVNPAGALLQAVLGLYNLVMFLIENFQRIIDFVNSVFNSIGEIARGAIGKASEFIEKAMARTVPIILNFLARLIGLSGIGKTVSNIITKIRKPIDKVVDKALDFIVKQAKKLFGRKKGSGKEGGAVSPADEKKHQGYVKEIFKALRQPAKGGKFDTFEKFYHAKVKEAKALQKTYQAKVKKHIKVHILFKPLAEEKKDQDLDIKVKIAPNTTTGETEIRFVASEVFEDADIKLFLDSAIPMLAGREFSSVQEVVIALQKVEKKLHPGKQVLDIPPGAKERRVFFYKDRAKGDKVLIGRIGKLEPYTKKPKPHGHADQELYVNLYNNKEFVKEKIGQFVPRFLYRNISKVDLKKIKSPENVEKMKAKGRKAKGKAPIAPTAPEKRSHVTEMQHVMGVKPLKVPGEKEERKPSPYVSFTKTGGVITDPNGKDFNKNGKVKVDMLYIARSAIRDLSTKKGKEVYMLKGKKDEGKLTDKQKQALEDVVRTQEVLITAEIPWEAIVEYQPGTG